MKIGERAQKRREQLGLTQQQVADKVGVEQASYARLEAGEVEHPRYLKKLSSLFEVTQEWLMYGIGHVNLDNNKFIFHEKRYIPVITWEEALEWENIGKNYPISNDTEIVPMVGHGSPNSYALRVKSDAMISPLTSQQSFFENSTIIIDPKKNPAPSNFIIAKKQGIKEAIFRQYAIDSGSEYLKALNPQYPIIKLDEKIKIIGVVIAYIDVLA